MSVLRFYYCPVCDNGWQVGGNPEEMNSLLERDYYNCIVPSCDGLMKRNSVSLDGATFRNIPLRQFYRAINGFGLAKGAAASNERFIELLKTKKIVEVVSSPIGDPERVILRHLILEDGTRLHFETSAQGACCYYIEEVGPSCLEVFDNEDDSSSAVEGSDPDRAQTGRAPEVGAGADDQARTSTGDGATPEQHESGGVPGVQATESLQTGNSTTADGHNGHG